MSQPRYILYGAEHSFYTLKVWSYLRYKALPFRFRPATLWVYQRLIIPRTGVRFIPVLQTPDDQLIQDTSDIIDIVESRHADQRSIQPPGPKQRLTALLFELYADEWFLLPGMHYRWSYLHAHEAYLMEEFGRVVSPLLPAALQRALGRRISAPFKQSLKPLGITARSGPAIEAWFQQFLADFESHLAQHDYLLGSRPCLGDFALAGPLTAHTARDPYSRALLQQHAPRTLQWIARIQADEQPEGAFLEDDQVPQTLDPILRHLFAEHWPILLDTARRLPQWLAQHPEKTHISRAIGEHNFSIGGVQEQRLVFPYAQWMMQRPLDAYASLSSAEQQEVNRWLAGLGAEHALQFVPPQRVKRVNNRLVAA